MNTAVTIAQIFALVYLSVSLGFLLNKKHYENLIEGFMSSPPLLYLSGLSALTAGFFILKFHSFLHCDWTSVITVFALLAMLKGVLLLVVPDKMVAMLSNKSFYCSHFNFLTLLSFLLGLFFFYYGFLDSL